MAGYPAVSCCLDRSLAQDNVADYFISVRYQVMSADPINFVAEANKLAEMIKQYDLI